MSFLSAPFSTTLKSPEAGWKLARFGLRLAVLALVQVALSGCEAPDEGLDGGGGAGGGDGSTGSAIISAPLSTITGTGPVIANGTDSSIITITLRTVTNQPAAGIRPTFSATNTLNRNTYGVCTPTNSQGVSTCSLRSSQVEIKTLAITSPISKVGGTVAFNSGVPTKLAIRSTLPPSVTVNAPLTQNVVVEVQAAAGSKVPSPNFSVTVAAYLDAACTVPASGNLSAASNPIVTNNGQATFLSLAHNQVESIYIGATTAGLTTACSSTSIDIQSGPPVDFNSSISGSSPVTANGTSDSTITIYLRDADGFGVPGIIPTFGATNTASGNAYGPCTTTDVTGLSTCQLRSTVAESKTLDLLTPVLKTGGSVSFVAGPAAKLAVSISPSSNNQARINWATAPTISVLDNLNNFVGTASNSITLAAFTDSACSTPASGSLSAATNPLNAVSGLAAFTNIQYTRGETIYLRASASGLSATCMGPIVVTGGTAVSANSSITATGPVVANGTSVSTVTITLRDINNIGVPGVTPTFNATDTLSANTYGSCSVTNSSGTSTCLLRSTKAEDKTPQLLTPVTKTGSTVSFVAGPASKLLYLVQPSATGIATLVLAQQPQVGVFDSFNNLVTSATNSVQLSAFTNATCLSAASGTLSATTNPISALSGTANFSGVGYNRSETVYLGATSSGLSSVCSQSVTIAGGPATQLLITGPASVQAGSCSTSYTVQVLDVFGNNTTVAENINLSLSGLGAGAFYTSSTDCTSLTSPASSLPLGVGSGSANLFFRSTVAGSYTLQVSDSSSVLTLDTTNTFVTPASAAKLVFTSEPSSSGTTGQVLGLQPVVEVWDAYDNRVESATNAVTLSAFTDALCATGAGGSVVADSNPLAAVAGQASFSGVSYGNAGTIYLGASSGSLIGDCSSAIVLAPQITMTTSNVSVEEWGMATVTVNLSTAPTSNVTVDYYTQNSSATSGSDYTYVAGTLTFTPGTTTRQLFVPILHDWTPEGSETFFVQFTNVSGAVMPVTTATVTIIDNDFAAKTNFSAVSAVNSASHVCSINSSGAAECWGTGANGRLGNSGTANQSRPVQVSTLTSGVTRISAGGGGTCAVVSGGARCWGSGSNGENGNGATSDQTSPVNVTGLTTGVSDVAVGVDHACALTTAGAVRCWGRGGRLGNGGSTNSSTSVVVTGLTSGVTQISAGGNHACARLSTGAVRCWGINTNGQLGDNSTTNRTSPVNVLFGGSNLANATAVLSGGSHSCAIMTGGGVRCWGFNSNGQIGDGTTTQRNQAVDISGVSNVLQLSLGNTHSCALNSSGQVFCWGSNTYGSLGDGTTLNRLSPTQITTLGTNNVELSTGTNFTCVRKSTGRVQCVGDQTGGQLGNSSFGWRQFPVQGNTMAAADVTQISSGLDHFCYVDSAGAARCFGNNPNGQIGDATTGTPRLTPTQVSGLTTGVTMLSIGSNHGCALTTSGQVRCWGLNANGQLGNGTTTNAASPVTAISSGATEVSAGTSHTCAVVSGGARCWGINTNGLLGDGTTTQRTTPVNVSGLGSGVAQVAAGGNFSCARLTNNTVRCWGLNSNGQLGNGSTTSSTTPVTVTNLNDAVFLRAGASHACALRSSGAVACWGLGSSGQMGNNTATATNSSIVTPSVLGTNVTQLNVGPNHACARLSDSSMRCWGGGTNGEIGDNATANRLTPTLPSQIPQGVSTLHVNNSRTCAELNDGRALCWGRNFASELQDGLSNFSWTDVVQ